MRIKLLIPLAGAVALTAVCARSAGSTPPAIAAKKAEAARVLREIAAIDERLNMVSEQYDGARVRLDGLRKNLAAEQVALGKAKLRYQRAEQRAAKLLVWMYTSSHGSSLDVILGAHSLLELLQLSDAENELSRQAALIATQAAAAKRQLQATVRRLALDRKAAAATVNELAARRTEILGGLEQRRKLLASVESEVRKLEAAERARQERLAAEARARLAAELAAREKAAREAADRRAALAAQARAAAEAAATTTTTAPTTPTTTAPASAVPTTTTTTPIGPAAPSTIPTPTTPILVPEPITPTALLPPGHPDAAQIALSFLGVPYLWGGATPSGFDCSGLVTYVYAQLGVALPHFAAAQWTYGVPVAVSQLQAGDLVFFDALDHVGIYLGNDLFINAPHTGAFVRIDSLSERWYKKKYVGARRI
jgi:cell wall-associated NlpC family hydrolase